MRDEPQSTMPTEEVVIMMGVLGAALWAPVTYVASLMAAPPYTVWYFGAYPTMTIAAYAVGRWNSERPWLVSTTMLFSSYAVALFLVPGTGNLLPFELMLMALLSVPPALALRKGARIRSEPKVGENPE